VKDLQTVKTHLALLAAMRWYLMQRYTITETKIYEHLPFDVCFMEKII